ncbi:MAG: hypothetical protein IKK76_03895, partial [Alphaproteobacteria bacterium]|nr:hypothetical protein [Alphaproteobacteria bacterium]
TVIPATAGIYCPAGTNKTLCTPIVIKEESKKILSFLHTGPAQTFVCVGEAMAGTGSMKFLICTTWVPGSSPGMTMVGVMVGFRVDTKGKVKTLSFLRRQEQGL